MTADQLADKTDLADANGSATVLPCLLHNAQQCHTIRARTQEPSSIFFQLPPTACLATRTSNKKTLWHWAKARDYRSDLGNIIGEIEISAWMSESSDQKFGLLLRSRKDHRRSWDF